MSLSAENFTESLVEAAALAYFESLGYQVLAGPDIAPGTRDAERADYREVILERRLTDAIASLNPTLSPDLLADALRQVKQAHLQSPSLVATNRAFHKLLVEGVTAGTPRGDGSIAYQQVRLVDPEHPDANDWVVVNQFTVVEGNHTRRPDIVVFVNGLPLAIFELKNPTGQDASIWSAFHQLQTYKQQIPALFTFNELLVISDGLEARVGSLTADQERFVPWRTVDGETVAPPTAPQLEVLIRGLFDRSRLLTFIRHFVVFEDERHGVAKKIAAYHQFHAVNHAVDATAHAIRPAGNRRVGVIWHTQGSGKSLTMVFYAGRLALDARLDNPTIVVLTDRNDLDDQLFGTFSRCQELLRQAPAQADTRQQLRDMLQVQSGGIVFTTVQKFFPEESGTTFPQLSDRRNIVVIADEAHRSQYNFGERLDPKTGKIHYGFARNIRDALPHASFIGFTGTPIEKTDANTKAVFGDYIDVYDIQRAVEDRATVPIFYEGRTIKLGIEDEDQAKAEAAFAEVTEGEEEAGVQQLTARWTQLAAVAGADERLRQLAEDLVAHFENRQSAMIGKAMIVCMSRRICVDLYDQLIRLRPDWHGDDDATGQLKVVMTGSASDEQHWQQHIRPKLARERLADRFRDPEDHFRIVIVRDMWLTGFDAPSLHTMYIDKPMQGHGLMQAIARVNRVFRDKPGGLVVDYLGLGTQLRQALRDYTENGGAGDVKIDQNEVVARMKEKLENLRDLFHGLPYEPYLTGSPADRLGILKAAIEHVLAQDQGTDRLFTFVSQLSQAFALAVPHPDALAVRSEVAFFQAVRAALTKPRPAASRTAEQLDHAVRQIVSDAVTADGVVDIFAAAGLDRPDLSILSDEFFAEIRGLPQKNLAIEALRRLLDDQVRSHSARNVVQARAFGELLERAITRYHNKAIETAQVIEDLIELAKKLRAEHARGEQLGLSDAEIAFYDALATSDSAVTAMGDDTLKAIARELVETVRRNTTVDWTIKESAQANLRVLVRRVLRRYKYPPDKTEDATKTVLQQAAMFANAELAAP